MQRHTGSCALVRADNNSVHVDCTMKSKEIRVFRSSESTPELPQAATQTPKICRAHIYCLRKCRMSTISVVDYSKNDGEGDDKA